MTRKTLVRILILILCATVLMKPETAKAQEPEVHIPDAKLYKAILTELGQPRVYSVSDMRKLTELTAEERGISDLTGLEHATNLVKLNLMDNHISDVTPLANLTHLTELWLNGNDITDISALANLKNLTQLNLNGNDIVDISPLADLTHLIGLGLQANYITDISPLTGMKNLTQLNLNHNSQQLVDVAPLANLKNLLELDLGKNGISEVAPLANLTDLTLLALNHNAIVDVSPLTTLTQLGYLGLGNNRISDISPLPALTGLEVLELRDNPLSEAAVDAYIPAIEANGTEVYYGHTHSEHTDGEAHSHASDYIQHGREHHAAGDFAEAIADFDKAFQVGPDRPEVSYYRANAKFQLGKLEHEEGNVEQAKRTYHSAIEDYARVITLDPENPPAYIFGGMVHLRLADVADAEGNREQAKHHFHAVNKMGSQLTALDPGNASGWRTLGVANLRLGILAVYQGTGDPEVQRYYNDSLEAYTQAIALDPENPAPYASRADVHIHVGIWEMTRANVEQAHHQYQSAIQDSRQATLLSSTMEHALLFSLGLNNAYLKLGEAEVALGNIQEAQSHYQLAIDSLGAMTFLGQGSIAGNAAYEYLAEGKLKLGESHARLGNDQQAEQHYREALEDCQQLIGLFPKKARVFYIQGRVKAALADYTGAIADFERVIAITPDYALAYYAQGRAKQALGQPDAAEFDFAKARVLNPNVDKLYPFSYGGME